MLQPDWLSDHTLSTIGVQWLEDVYVLANYFHFFNVLENYFDVNV